MSDSDLLAVDWTDHEDPAVAVCQSIAELEAVEPTNLPPLYASIDSGAFEALDSLAHTSRPLTESRISFRYVGYDVTITHDKLFINPSDSERLVSGAGTNGHARR